MDTPRTDRQLKMQRSSKAVSDIDIHFARGLERELNAALMVREAKRKDVTDIVNGVMQGGYSIDEAADAIISLFSNK